VSGRVAERGIRLYQQGLAPGIDAGQWSPHALELELGGAPSAAKGEPQWTQDCGPPKVWPPARRYCTSEGPCFDVCKVGCVWEFHLSFETRAIGRWMRDSKLQRLGTAGSSSVVVVVVIGQTEGCLLACLLAPLPSCVSWSFSLTICHLLFSSYIHYNQCLCGGAPGWLSLEVSFRLQARAASRRIKWRPWRCWGRTSWRAA